MKTGKNLGRTRLGKQASHAPLTRISGDDRSQAGTTLVELMIAMIISSIVVFFLFTIQSRMSQAYNGQGTVSEITQNLQAARQMLVRDIRMAGYGLGDGTVSAVSAFDPTATVDGDGNISLPGFTVNNNANGDGNDSFRLLFANSEDDIFILGYTPGAGAKVWFDYDTPDGSDPGFSVNDTLIISGRNDSCIISITLITLGTPSRVHFSNTGAFNSAQNNHCDDALSGTSIKVSRLSSRSYRIDPIRKVEGYLQMSPSGEVVANDWVDMGVGFTNLQIATRYFNNTPPTTLDPDGDGDNDRDWYSSGNQATYDPLTPAVTDPRQDDAVLIQVSLSLEGRGAFGSKGSVPSITTPAFIDMANPDHNSIGDWGQTCASAPAGQNPCGIHLALVPDASRTGVFERYQGEHVYRYIKATIDLRNMGVGIGN
ncbi:MAG: prepilin-type N-terminal cleavage/methylation domain-containing protein [Kofleriaceae bacterium]|nr:prepilin-type N-terminal cleavage/methylation domain-containing protein [Kofleriaceae bacterium]